MQKSSGIEVELAPEELRGDTLESIEQRNQRGARAGTSIPVTFAVIWVQRRRKRDPIIQDRNGRKLHVLVRDEDTETIEIIELRRM